MPALICLPPAGAGPGLFRPWQRLDAGVRAPGIPGREGRFREPPEPDLPALAARIAAEVAPGLPARYGLFGYSMGGALAFLLAERLVAQGLPGPEALFLLGAPPPDGLDDGTAAFHRLESPAFWAEIARLGGTPPEIIADAEMRALFEPALRQDFRLCESYRHETGFRLSCPVQAFVGADDHLVDAAAAGKWAAFTTGPVRVHAIPGGHMLDPAAFAALYARVTALWPDRAPA